MTEQLGKLFGFATFLTAASGFRWRFVAQMVRHPFAFGAYILRELLMHDEIVLPLLLREEPRFVAFEGVLLDLLLLSQLAHFLLLLRVALDVVKFGQLLVASEHGPQALRRQFLP